MGRRRDEDDVAMEMAVVMMPRPDDHQARELALAPEFGCRLTAANR